jgi:hypothetical protein
MAVRNFWIEVYVDGRKTKVECGPQAKDGGAIVTIYQRSDGAIKKAAEIFCTESDGCLESSIGITGKPDHVFCRTNR